MRHPFIFTGCALGLLAFASMASAEPTPSDVQKARDLMTTGRAQRSTSDLEGALKSFSAANELMHVPTTLFEVAATQSALGKLLAARDTLKELARLETEPDEPEAFTKARHAGYELATSIEPRIPSLDVAIEGDSSVRDSHLSIDGRPSLEGREFNHIQLDPGKHRLVATSGALRREENISLTESEIQRIEISFPASAASETREPTPRGAALPRSDDSWAVYSLAGLGVVGVGAGLGFFAEAKHVKSSLEASCAPVCTQAQADRVGHWTTAGDVSIAVGSAALVAAVVVWVVQSGHSDSAPAGRSSALAIQVLPSTQGAALQAAGRF